MENEAWTTKLGRELQQMSQEGISDRELYALEHNLRQAIQQVRFVRSCYNKEAHTPPQGG